MTRRGTTEQAALGSASDYDFWFSGAFARVRNGKGTLMGVVTKDLPCGCAVTGAGTLPHPLTVKLCKAHRAALTGGGQ